MSEYLLEVKNLKKYFVRKGGFFSGPTRSSKLWMTFLCS